MSFQQQLERGQAGESRIAQYLIERGASVLPVYEKIIDNGKGRACSRAAGNLSRLIC